MFIKTLGYKILSWLDALVRWHTRPKSKLMVAGRSLVNLGVVGLLGIIAFKVTYDTPEGGKFAFSVQDSDLPSYLVLVLLGITALGVVLIIIDVFRFIKDSKDANNIIIEYIALFPPLSTSFSSTVTKTYGKTIPHKIDITEYYLSGVLTKPQDAITDTRVMLRRALVALSNATGNNKAVIHYGGTPPVSFGFYAGHMVGNTTDVILWDYDRNAGLWHSLDRSFDDNKPFISLDEYEEDTKEITLLMNISFDVEKVARDYSSTSSIVTISMPRVEHDNMSSLSKLNEFLTKFRELLNRLSRDGVQRVHVFCAAQASFNFAVGQQITRNHPIFVVYEYVHTSENKYPWGLEFNNPDRQVNIINQ